MHILFANPTMTPMPNARKAQTTNDFQRSDPDPFNAVVKSVRFVVHRRKSIGWSINKIHNPHHDVLALALSGCAHYTCGQDRFEATRGELLYFPAGTQHSAHSDARSPWSFYSVGFVLDPQDDASRSAFNDLPRHQHLDNFTQISDYFRQLETLWRTQGAGYAMACRGWVLLLLQQYVDTAVRQQRNLPHAETIEAIIEQMHDQVGVVQSVAALARQADLSESRFRVLFRQLTGCSVTRYQNRLRIEEARDLLVSGHYTVGEVAEEMGFQDVYYFSRLFKTIAGVPPSHCRHR